MELSKKAIGNFIRGTNHGTVQLKRVEFSTKPERDILCDIIVKGVTQKGYSCCCICKKLLKKGGSNKACRNKHISKHYAKGDLIGPNTLVNLVENFNRLHRRF